MEARENSLVLGLDDPEEIVREMAAKALGEIGDNATLEPLIRILEEDTSGYVRAAAAVALGKIGNQCAVEPLIRALSDSFLCWEVYEGRYLVRIAAGNALFKIAPDPNTYRKVRETERIILLSSGPFQTEPLPKPQRRSWESRL